MEDNNRKFNQLYSEIFDSRGNVKRCGRQKCKELMKIAYAMDNSQTDYGDLESGFMNVKNIKALHNRIMEQ